MLLKGLTRNLNVPGHRKFKKYGQRCDKFRAENRLSATGLKPFGSHASVYYKRKSQGARLREETQGVTAQRPLNELLHRIKKLYRAMR